jgi:hypothetical protein
MFHNRWPLSSVKTIGQNSEDSSEWVRPVSPRSSMTSKFLRETALGRRLLYICLPNSNLNHPSPLKGRVSADGLWSYQLMKLW